jgi:hypothetical protein
MANSDLIQGEKTMRGGGSGSGFVNYAAGMKAVTTDRSAIIQAKAEEKQKALNATNTANKYMDKMKSDFDFTGLDEDTQKAMRDYLVTERSKYAYAASQIAKIEDHTSPEYQYYIDEMNSVQQGFLNLSNQVKAYKDNKVQYGELTKSGQWSLGAGSEIEAANSVFGLSENKAKISVLPGGKLGYDLGDGNIQSFDDFQMPTMRAYDTANSIMSLANDYYNKGVPMNEYARSVVSSKIDGFLKSPDQLKSLVSGDFDSDGLSFGDIEWDPNNIDAVRQQVKDRVLSGVDAAAAEGKAYKDSQKKPTGGVGTTTPTEKQDDPDWAKVDDDKTVGVKYQISGHTVYRSKDNPDVYFVDGVAFPSRQDAYDAI